MGGSVRLQMHVYITRVTMDSLPSDSEGISKWCKDTFLEKVRTRCTPSERNVCCQPLLIKKPRPSCARPQLWHHPSLQPEDDVLWDVILGPERSTVHRSSFWHFYQRGRGPERRHELTLCVSCLGSIAATVTPSSSCPWISGTSPTHPGPWLEHQPALHLSPPAG